MKKARFLLLPVLVLPVLLRAGETLRLKSVSGEVPVPVETKKDRIMVDLVRAAEGLGGKVSIKDDAFVLEFSSGTAVVDPQTGLYRVRKSGEKKWRAAGLDPAPYFSGKRLMVGLGDLPALTFRNLTYHRQRKQITEEAALPAPPKDWKPAPARRTESGRKEWISLEDAAQALGIVIYSAQPRTYSLVLPDFSILEVAVGDMWAYRGKQRFKPLPDPILEFSGVPYATLSTLSNLFDADLRWDPDGSQLLVPIRYGRLKDLPQPGRLPLTVVGYLPKPLRLSVDEASAFYQNPGPTYPADHPDLYESARDFLTNQPIHPPTRGYDRMSGSAILNLDGGLLGGPVEGGGRFEKTGTRGSLMNGSLQWGFPGLRIRAAREYMTMGNFYQQFDRVDQVTVSHNSDAYGEGRKSTWETKALYGRDLFDVFVTTDIFSQTVNYAQTMAGGSMEGKWSSGGQALSGGLTFFRFTNEVLRFTDQYNFLGDLNIDGLVVDVTPAESKALASEFLTDRHNTVMADASYQAEGWGRLDVDGGMSRFQKEDGRLDRAGDWRVAGTLGEKTSRILVSHERVGADYRALGDPSRYQNRHVTRVSPYLDLAQPWKIYGDFTREDFFGAEVATLPPYRNDSFFVTNALNFATFDLRGTASMFDNTLYGKRWSGALDHTRYLGRDSVQAGVSWASQWFGDGPLYRQSYTARLGGQFLRPLWKLTVGEELTRHHYPFYKLDIWKAVSPQFPNRWESSTYAQWRWRKLEGAVQYNVAPRNYREAEILHTGYARFGYRVNEKKAFNVFGALTSLNQGLNSPQVWRAGIEYVNDFF